MTRDKLGESSRETIFLNKVRHHQLWKRAKSRYILNIKYNLSGSCDTYDLSFFSGLNYLFELPPLWIILGKEEPKLYSQLLSIYLSYYVHYLYIWFLDYNCIGFIGDSLTVDRVPYSLRMASYSLIIRYTKTYVFSLYIYQQHRLKLHPINILISSKSPTYTTLDYEISQWWILSNMRPTHLLKGWLLLFIWKPEIALKTWNTSSVRHTGTIKHHHPWQNI